MIVSRSTSCPYCGDEHFNLCYTVYDNGDFCFSCHRGNIKKDENYIYRKKELAAIQEERNLVLPEFTDNPAKFSPVVLEWLYSYHLYDADIKDNGILYCPAQDGRDDSVLLTIRDDNNKIVEYQRRFFPKSFFSSSGMKSSLFIKSPDNNSSVVYLVEDYISTIRVGEHIDCLCLFGTDLTKNTVKYILNQYQKIVVWLDPDKPGQDSAVKIIDKLDKEIQKLYKDFPFKYICSYEVQNLFTEKQPKEYSKNEIKNIIKQNI